MMVLLGDDLGFVVPEALEAHEPPEARGVARDQVRLLVSYRSDDRIVHARFIDLPAFLSSGDLLVVNDSATIPAALKGMREDGSEITLHLSTHLEGSLWAVEPRKVSVAAGEKISLPEGGSVTFQEPYRNSSRLWTADLDLPRSVLDYLYRWGRPISYPYVPDAWPIQMYQTVYAARPGSVEMPSAGRAFSPRVLDALKDKGVSVATVTLHTGVSSLEGEELPYPERFEVPAGTVAQVDKARQRGGRVIAVGTTVVRALETAGDDDGIPAASKGWTDIVVTPERGVRVVDSLLTGFHEPRSTHLSMLQAIASPEHLRKSYAAAIHCRYLWHEFGDLHLIL